MSVQTHPQTTVVRRGAARARRTVRVCFAVYLALLAWIILFKLGTPHFGTPFAGVPKLVPFEAAQGFGSSAPREVLANVALFVPFGIYAGALARRGSVVAWMLLIAAASVGLEFLQFALGVGSADVSDVITNSLGGTLGLLGAWMLRGRRPLDDASLMRCNAIATTLGLILCLGVAVSVA